MWASRIAGGCVIGYRFFGAEAHAGKMVPLSWFLVRPADNCCGVAHLVKFIAGWEASHILFIKMGSAKRIVEAICSQSISSEVSQDQLMAICLN